MNFDISHEGRTTLAVDYAGAIELGYPAALAVGALKSAAKGQVAGFAEGMRNKLASVSAGKIAEWNIKAEVALDPANADATEKALVERGGKANGRTLTKEFAAIIAKRKAYRQIALLIGVLEDETGAAITAIPDDAPDIEVQIETVLGAAKTQAETAFAEAITKIQGGS